MMATTDITNHLAGKNAMHVFDYTFLQSRGPQLSRSKKCKKQCISDHMHWNYNYYGHRGLMTVAVNCRKSRPKGPKGKLLKIERK